MVYMAVATDLTSDGLMVGTGTAVETQLGFLFAATQSVANIPGGFAATSNFRDDGMPRSRRLALSASMLVPALISAGWGISSCAERVLQYTARLLPYSLVSFCWQQLMMSYHRVTSRNRPAGFRPLRSLAVLQRWRCYRDCFDKQQTCVCAPLDYENSLQLHAD